MTNTFHIFMMQTVSKTLYLAPLLISSNFLHIRHTEWFQILMKTEGKVYATPVSLVKK